MSSAIGTKSDGHVWKNSWVEQPQFESSVVGQAGQERVGGDDRDGVEASRDACRPAWLDRVQDPDRRARRRLPAAEVGVEPGLPRLRGGERHRLVDQVDRTGLRTRVVHGIGADRDDVAVDRRCPRARVRIRRSPVARPSARGVADRRWRGTTRTAARSSPPTWCCRRRRHRSRAPRAACASRLDAPPLTVGPRISTLSVAVALTDSLVPGSLDTDALSASAGIARPNTTTTMDAIAATRPARHA